MKKLTIPQFLAILALCSFSLTQPLHATNSILQKGVSSLSNPVTREDVKEDLLMFYEQGRVKGDHNNFLRIACLWNQLLGMHNAIRYKAATDAGFDLTKSKYEFARYLVEFDKKYDGDKYFFGFYLEEFIELNNRLPLEHDVKEVMKMHSINFKIPSL